VLPADWSSRLRRSDLWARDGDVVRILCLDTDVSAAERVLEALGLSKGAADLKRVRVDVARTRDFLSLRRPSHQNVVADR